MPSKLKDYPYNVYTQIEAFANDFGDSDKINMAESDKDFMFTGLDIVKKGLEIMQKACDLAYCKAHKEFVGHGKGSDFKKQVVADIKNVTGVDVTGDIDLERDIRR